MKTDCPVWHATSFKWLTMQNAWSPDSVFFLEGTHMSHYAHLHWHFKTTRHMWPKKKKKHTVEWTVWLSQITYFNVMVCCWYGMQLDHYSLMLYILGDLYLVLGLKRTSTELHVSVNWFMLVFWAQKFLVFNF